MCCVDGVYVAAGDTEGDGKVEAVVEEARIWAVDGAECMGGGLAAGDEVPGNVAPPVGIEAFGAGETEGESEA